MQRLAPHALAADGLPRGAHQVVVGGGLSGDHRQDLVGRAGLVERLDERLNHAEGAVQRTDVAPGFQRMALCDAPVALARRLVLVEAE